MSSAAEATNCSVPTADYSCLKEQVSRLQWLQYLNLELTVLWFSDLLLFVDVHNSIEQDVIQHFTSHLG